MSAVAALPPAVQAEIANAEYWIRASQMSFVAWYAIALWDWVTSLPREYRLIHKAPWSIVKVLYLLCRYWIIVFIPFILWVFIGNHSVETCKWLFRLPEIIAMWDQIWAECVLVVRTYAFFGNSFPMLIFLCTGMLGMVTFQVWCVIHGMSPLGFLPGQTAGPCFPTVTYPGSPLIMIFFLLPLVFDSIITVLTIHRNLQLRKRVAGGSSSPILRMFIREGLFYFILISCANLVNAIFYWQPNAAMSALNIPFSVMLTDILACRLILDLRDRGSGGQSAHVSGSGISHSGPGARRMGTKPGTAIRGPDTISNTKIGGGAITQMDFNHELTTFHDGKQVVVRHGDHGDSSSEVDVKAIPLGV